MVQTIAILTTMPRYIAILFALPLLLSCGESQEAKLLAQKKAEEKALYLCEIGVDSLLQYSLQSSNKIKDKLFGKFVEDFDRDGHFMGEGYVDGHCLDSGKSLLLLHDRMLLVLEYGNFSKGYYMVDSVILPHFDFKVFKDRQQIVLQELDWDSGDPYIKYLRAVVDGVKLESICPYKDKIFGISYGTKVIVMDAEKKSYETLVRYDLSEPDSYERLPHLPYWEKHEGVSRYLNLIRMRNDTIVVSSKRPKKGLMDTLLITPDGENFVPKISDSLCLRIDLKNGNQRYAADKEKCFGKW